MSEFNGWAFNNQETRERMEYLVVMSGDLDLNNAYGFESEEDLNLYLQEECNERTLAVFKVKDKTFVFNVFNSGMSAVVGPLLVRRRRVMRLLRIISLTILCGGFLGSLLFLIYVLGTIVESLQY